MRQYQREWIKQRRVAWLRANGPCARCGSTQDLEVDHVDPTTKDPLLRKGTSLWSWSEERRAVELAKCQVLCGSCHQTKTRLENTRPVVHGRVTTYDKRGCRCDLCRAVKSQHMKERRSRGGAWIPRQRTAASEAPAPCLLPQPPTGRRQ